MEINVLAIPERNVIARGSYVGGPDYEFVVGERGQVFFQVVGDADQIWAGPDPEAFRQIAAAWNRYRDEVQRLPSEKAQLERVAQLRQELQELGALPTDLPPDPEPLWSLLLSEAEFGMA